MGSSVSRTKLTHHIIGEDRRRRIAWNYDCKGETTRMTAEATSTSRLDCEQAERKEERKERMKAKELDKNVGKLTFL